MDAFYIRADGVFSKSGVTVEIEMDHLTGTPQETESPSLTALSLEWEISSSSGWIPLGTSMRSGSTPDEFSDTTRAWPEEHRNAEDLVARNNKLLEVKSILAFPEVAAVPSYEAGVITVAQSNGYAGLASNTVMFGWPGDDAERLAGGQGAAPDEVGGDGRAGSRHAGPAVNVRDFSRPPRFV